MPNKEYKINKHSLSLWYHDLTCPMCDESFNIHDKVITHSTTTDYHVYHKRCWNEQFY